MAVVLIALIVASHVEDVFAARAMRFTVAAEPEDTSATLVEISTRAASPMALAHA
nr:hypothetical protein [Kofleriaceae bacterium]